MSASWVRGACVGRAKKVRPVLDHFSLLAPLYERVMRPKDLARLCELLHLPADGLLLDAGGGTGRVSRGLAGAVGGLVIADMAPGMLRQALDKGSRTVTLAAVQALPFADGAFARVLSVDALHHFADQAGALAELWRVLAPGGRLVIEEPDIRRTRIQWIALAERMAMMQSHFLAPAAIIAMLRRLDIAAEVVEDGGLNMWIVAERPS